MDGEVNSVDLALTGEDLLLTIGRSVGADLTATATIPEGLPLVGGEISGPTTLVTGPTLTVTKNDTGNHPVIRMVTPNNQTPNGQRPFNARRDGESDYFEVNGRLGGGNANPGIGIGPGGAARDVILYRDSADVWRTPDAFHVGELRVDTTGVVESRDNLGLGNLAVLDTVGAGQIASGLTWADFA